MATARSGGVRAPLATMATGAVAAGKLSQYFGRLDSLRQKNNINLEQCQAAKRKALLQFCATNPDETVCMQHFTNKRLMQGENSSESHPRSSSATPPSQQRGGVVLLPYAFEFLDLSMLLQMNLISRQLQRRVNESQTWAILRYHRLEHNHDHEVRVFASNQRLLFSGDCFGIIKVWDMLEKFKYMRNMHCQKKPINDPKVGSSSSDDASGDEAKSGSTGTMGGVNIENTNSSMPESNNGTKTEGFQTSSSHTRNLETSAKDSSLNEGSSNSDQKGGSSDTFSAEASDEGSGCCVSKGEARIFPEGKHRQFQKLLWSYNNSHWESVKAHRGEIKGKLSHNDVEITSCLQG
jgi:hypothetical protein